MKKLRILSWAAVILLSACQGKSTSKEVASVQKHQVKVEAVSVQNVEQNIEFTGSVESFNLNDICPSMPVRIDRILVEVGDKVTKGQLLVEMDISQKQQAQIQLDNMEIEYKRISELFKAGGASQQQVDQLKSQLDVMRTSIKNLMDNTQLRSPMNGVITARYYHPGEMFSMSPSKSGKAAILTVMELAPLKVLISVSEEYFPKIKHGMKVDVRSDIYPTEVFAGKVHLIYPTIDVATRTFTVEISIDNKNLKIRPGMFSRVRLNLGSMNRVCLPDLAIVRQMGTNDRYVFVEDGGVVEKRKVTVGQQIGSLYEVLSGLKEGERVVIAGQSRLVDQSEVEVINK